MNGVAAGLVTGIALVTFFVTFPIPTYPGYRESASLPDIDDYPYLQLYVRGLKSSYAAGERIDFQITQIAGGCAYPESIAVKEFIGGLTVYEFNGTEASSLLFCPVLVDPADFRMQWNSDDPIAIREAGKYSLVVTHMYRTIEQHFSVHEGVGYVSVVTIPQGASVQEFGVSFKPEVITVVIGHNSTVKWINNDIVVHRIEADKTDTAFHEASSGSRVKPGQSFEYEFVQTGIYEYYSDPWNQGSVVVMAPVN